jgi:tetratricopeptide (TPR) repeat protein
MSSIIEGYNYDIFISYRQKDNKGDKWVSEFVEALKTELESTFKEEVSVYFDINPHDGLLETHDVNESLKEKLKCLVFIPIISRTYCDPKSFAWEHEFKAFVEIASQDQFGLKVKLPNGNVASRVIPIQIYDLKSEDKVLVEKELGGFIRAIEFIYKESGVNRPITPKDSEEKNTNKTNYRNQINKVANAIDEIISGLKAAPTLVSKEIIPHVELLEGVKKEERVGLKEKPVKLTKRKLVSGVAILAILIIAALLTYPEIFKKDTLEKLRSSGERIAVAVMPFRNMTNDTTKNFWQEMIQDNLINSLSNTEELTIRQPESIIRLLQNNEIKNYASITPSIASNVSQKLDANIFIHGSINQIGKVIRLNAKLIDSETEEVFKSFQIDGTEDNILNVADSLSVLIKDFLIISKLIKEGNPAIVKLEATTKYPEAFKCVINGNYAFFAKQDYPAAINLYLQAITIDSNYLYPATMIAYSYWNQSLYEEGKKWCQKVYEKKDQMPTLIKIYADILHAMYYETPYESIKYLKQLLEIDDQLPDAYTDIGFDYNRLDQYSRAIPELEKALEIYDKWGIKPLWSVNYTNLGKAYHNTGQYKKEKKIYVRAERDFPSDLDLLRSQVILALTERDTILTKEYTEKGISMLKVNSVSEADIKTIMADIYSEAGILNKAEECHRDALSLEPQNPVKMNNLAYFLIDKDRNINEGLALVDRALEISPNNYNCLHTKGWQLYKQGKDKESLEFLEKSDSLKPVYKHELFLHLEAAKKAVANQK